MSRTPVPIADAPNYPAWRRPIALLILLSAGMPLSFATWNALLNNFVIEAASFDGSDIGWLQTVREIPGFAAIGVIAVIIFVREQTLALISLLALGAAVAVTAWFPTFGGLLITTFIGSLGFHYYETVNQSLQLQWLTKEQAPKVLGWILAATSAASLVAYALIVGAWKAYDLSYETVYLVGGAATVAVALFAWIAFPKWEAPNPQIKKMVLRRRYWLYYLMQFFSGARRQIFVVFAAFMMVEKFGFEVHEVTALFLINYLANMLFAPLVGRMIARFGERLALTLEYSGLVLVFTLYAGIYVFDWPAWAAAALYVIDHLLFAMAFALKTYFQKIAAPGDIAPTAAVAFTINHIAAVFLPAALGYLWLVSPEAVFVLAVGLAGCSLGLARLIPRHPDEGRETTLTARVRPTPPPPAAPAE
ncbi:MFS transporter [Albimonas pacifica]|uniref:Predicted arabinose efflux permease, MFS family n=1 Tax=Albimonas pacifica TaxID=1114924 RepID=A0A1I3IJT3_9RHOB|nr:MFS transporter [Albimonas pacifica]SFI48285.1 Predicted arabinose efflux permease, MFS family [Albimonas pacifica]